MLSDLRDGPLLSLPLEQCGTVNDNRRMLTALVYSAENDRKWIAYQENTAIDTPCVGETSPLGRGGRARPNFPSPSIEYFGVDGASIKDHPDTMGAVEKGIVGNRQIKRRMGCLRLHRATRG